MGDLAARTTGSTPSPSGFTPSFRGGEGPPMVCLHGFTDTWRTWDLVRPALERHHDVFSPTLAGHAGGPALRGDASDTALVDAVERSMDEIGFERAHIVGNSLGGYIALQLAQRGRADTVVALAPAGGWGVDDKSYLETLAYFTTAQELVKNAAPYADAIVATPGGRRQATAFTTINYEHIPAELLAHQIRGAANCEAAARLIEYATENGYTLDGAQIACPVRIVWGTADQLLPWPSAAARFHEWIPHADWVELDDVGHMPQIDVPLVTSELILGFTAPDRSPALDRER
jgi:pimeloyl-ACP methyl ester carboxylesterase